MSAGTPVLADRFGHPVRGEAASVEAWDAAWSQFLHFTGDPIVTLAPHIEADDTFVMGSVFVAAYLVLGGTRFDDPALLTSIDVVRTRAETADERAHLGALEQLVAGEFTAAAGTWDDIARSARDFAAVRVAHDIYLHVGDADRRLASSSRATAEWGAGEPGSMFVAGQYAFALEESGRYSDAERVGRHSLDADPDDLWARHALAHVYESLDDQRAALDLLEGSFDRWSRQDSLAVHIWWHLGLRRLSVGDVGATLDIVDRTIPDATTGFRLCDITSLLWRIELAGASVGDRWDIVADRWSDIAQRHACAFLDTHAVLAFARRPDHPGAAVWRDGLEHAFELDRSENATTFADVVRPLATAITMFADGDVRDASAALAELDTDLHRIGGSVAQRDVISLTRLATGSAR